MHSMHVRDAPCRTQRSQVLLLLAVMTRRGFTKHDQASIQLRWLLCQHYLAGSWFVAQGCSGKVQPTFTRRAWEGNYQQSVP